MPSIHIEDLTGPALRHFRTESGLSIKNFWAPLGCSLSQGHSYEVGKTPIPVTARKLFYLHYILGVPLDFERDEFTDFAAVMEARLAQNLRTERNSVEHRIERLNEGLKQAN